MVEPTQVYIGLAIVGFFSGLGTAAGQYIFNEYIKPKVEKHIKKGKLPKIEVEIW